ncbi:MAG TPA: hypothetical protein VMV49_09450 [Candidatus Deferrimicrobium sp.]|nr:hypothetical protein [Candidatus Deferrimicrobium sp.]
MKEIPKNEMVLFFDLEDDYKLETPETEVPVKFRVLNRSPKDYMLTFRIRFSTSMDVKVPDEFKEISTKKILPGDDFEAETRMILKAKGKQWILITGSFSTTDKDRTFQMKLPFKIK